MNQMKNYQITEEFQQMPNKNNKIIDSNCNTSNNKARNKKINRTSNDLCEMRKQQK